MNEPAPATPDAQVPDPRDTGANDDGRHRSPAESAEGAEGQPPLTVRRSRRPAIFGEILFDHFPDGSAVLGGAPFNVAWNAQGLGLSPLVISRIGEDEDGGRILKAMSDWNMDSGGVQRDARHPTGSVEVRLDNGSPTFEIKPDQAYDHIELEPARAAMGDASYHLLYHGTLALRSAISRETLRRLRASTGLDVFLDVNLRAPWWSRDLVEESLDAARWVKLNDHELETIAQQSIETANELRRQCERLRANLELELLIVTAGAQGAYISDATGRWFAAAPVSHEAVKDTVGAGDAFSSVCILGLARGWPPEQILERAVRFASDVCRIRGATTFDRALYTRRLETWKKSND